MEMDSVLSQRPTFYTTDRTLKGKNAMTKEKYLNESWKRDWYRWHEFTEWNRKIKTLDAGFHKKIQ